MNRHARLVIVVLMAGGCGAGKTTPPTSRIAERMAGEWSGDAFISTAGDQGVTTPFSVTVTLSDEHHAVISGLCPSGPDVVIVGEGTRIIASDTITCSPAPRPGCEDTSTVFTALEVSLFSGANLNITGNGAFVGCGAATPFRFVFDAVR